MNKEKLEQVIDNRLGIALEKDVTSDEGKQAFKEAMEAMDRKIQLEKISDAEKEQKKNRIIKIVEVAAIPVALFVADVAFKTYYMKTVCNFEKDYTFTTSPGKGLSSLFRFKK